MSRLTISRGCLLGLWLGLCAIRAGEPVDVAHDRELAEQGDARAQYALGHRYLHGIGVAANTTLALQWFTKSANQKNPDALRDVGILTLTGNGVTRDEKTAVRILRMAADLGSIKAQADLGYVYLYGEGVAQDYTQAHIWYSKAAEQGDPTGEQGMATLFANGWGVSKDAAQSMEWTVKAAEGGNAFAQTDLGTAYQTGNGQPKDLAQAKIWYEKATAQNDPEAMNDLGYLYTVGLGVPVDYAQAMTLYQKAAGYHFGPAESNIGALYEAGDGVPRDLDQARQWYQKAIEDGNAPAKEKLARVAAQTQTPAPDSMGGGIDTPPAQEADSASSPAPAAGRPITGMNASEWANAFFSSRFVSSAQIFDMIKSVRLVIKANSTLLGQTDMTLLTDSATSTLGKYGITVDMNSPFTLTVDGRLTFTDYTQARVDEDGNHDDWKFKVLTLFVKLDLSTRTACLHRREFVPLTVKLYGNAMIQPAALNWARDMSPSQARDYFSKTFDDELQNDIEHVRAETDDETSDDREQWNQLRWPSREDGTMFEAWKKAMQTPDSGTDRCFRDLDSMTVLINHDGPGIDDGDLQRRWEQSLPQAGFKPGPYGQHWLNHHVVACKSSMNDNNYLDDTRQDYFDDWGEIDVYEHNVVFLVNGTLYRTIGSIWNSEAFGNVGYSENAAELDALISGQIDNFTKESSYRR